MEGTEMKKITCFVLVRPRKERKTTQSHSESHFLKKLVISNILNFLSWANWPWLRSLTGVFTEKVVWKIKHSSYICSEHFVFCTNNGNTVSDYTTDWKTGERVLIPGRKRLFPPKRLDCFWDRRSIMFSGHRGHFTLERSSQALKLTFM